MKKASMPQNVLIIDSDYYEARDFVKGLRETTHEKWKVALHENNKIYGMKRYIKFFTLALKTVMSAQQYEGKTVLCWQQFYGIEMCIRDRYRILLLSEGFKETDRLSFIQTSEESIRTETGD